MEFLPALRTPNQQSTCCRRRASDLLGASARTDVGISSASGAGHNKPEDLKKTNSLYNSILIPSMNVTAGYSTVTRGRDGRQVRDSASPPSPSSENRRAIHQKAVRKAR